MTSGEFLTPPIRLREVARSALTRRIDADAEARGRIARELGLDGLNALKAELTIGPWLDGASIKGRWSAEAAQTCGVTLEPMTSALAGEFEVRVVPAGSANAPEPTEEEQVIDPDADDPPDVLDTDLIDPGGYLIEQLALEIDPFPRKPGAVFEPPDEPEPPSPFEALRNFKAGKTSG
jgi:hypothetical protein